MSKMSKRLRSAAGVTLVELLVVIAIIMILMAIMASALGAFAHTSRVEAASGTLATMFREARYYAMARNVNVMPMILRDTKGNFTGVYAAHALKFNGSLGQAEAAPITYPPAVAGSTSSPWSFVRRTVANDMEDGAFAIIVGGASLDLNDLNAAQPYYEMVYMKMTPPADPNRKTDASQYTYEIMARGVHNTKVGTFDFTTMGYGGADVYVIVSATNVNATVGPANARDYALSGINIPDHVIVDQVPSAEIPGDPGPVAATVNAVATHVVDQSVLAMGGGAGVYPPKPTGPLFQPIFTPDGHVQIGPGANVLGGLEAVARVQYALLPLRVMDTITREKRYVVVRMADGQVFVSSAMPKGIYVDGGDALNYDEIPEFDPSSSTTTTASTTSTTTTSSMTTATTANSASTTTNSATTTANSTASTTANSTASTSSTSNSSSTTSTATSGATSSATSTSSSTSNSSATTSANSTSTSNSTSTASTSTTTTASSSGAPPGSGGASSSSGGTSSGNGFFGG
ncbi:MAG: prepilin-type N-terminal cleavage/methylation domain-containing protein [Planctomycetes bacterium]|nr:prepilin-type N-terminal cleavage/methylation domain-containing protein [Planctomycetota bacterium]